MYVRDGQRMPEKEEGAAFFQPIPFSGPDPEERRVWGVNPRMLEYGFGQDASLVPPDAPPDVPPPAPEPAPSEPFYDTPFWRLLSLSGAAIGAYHGYKRNDSVGWAIGWALLGSIFPVIVIPVAFAQGVGKPKR